MVGQEHLVKKHIHLSRLDIIKGVAVKFEENHHLLSLPDP